MMNPKVTAEHLGRSAVVYVRQSTSAQVAENKESQRRQYALAGTAKSMGFATVEVIDDDLGRSGSGLVHRPGFQRLVAAVCNGGVGAVFCLEASRLARNGRDWHHLIDLCAMVGTLVIDPEGVYEPRLLNDRLILGLKGTMSEYELGLLRQRGLAARDQKAKRGELRVGLPPGYCWDEVGRIDFDPDERVAGAVRLVFRRFRELGSARQVLLWAVNEGVQLPVMRAGPSGYRVHWRAPAYHTMVSMLRNPMYAGAYAFGRTEIRTRVVNGRAVKTGGHRRPRDRWLVLLQDHHPGYISWEEFEHNQRMLAENAHMKKRAARKSGRGGRALLTGMIRCGQCGRMLHVFYGMRSGHAHRYMCRGDQMRSAGKGCLGIGGVRVDRAVAREVLEAVQPHAIEAAMTALSQAKRLDEDVRQAIVGELDEARYEARLAERRHAAVDPDKRQVARQLEARWEAALGRVAQLETKLSEQDRRASQKPAVDRAALLQLATDLPAAWNATTTDTRTKQQLVRVVLHEVVVDIDDASNEVVLMLHWVGGRHTEIRVARVKTGRYPADRRPSPVEAVRKLGGKFPDREVAVAMNRMRCARRDGNTWTTQRVRELRERLGVAEYDPSRANAVECVTLDEAACRLSICVGSVYRLIREGTLPATQVMPSAPWQIPVSALESEAVKEGVQQIRERRPRNCASYQDTRTLRLPGF